MSSETKEHKVKETREKGRGNKERAGNIQKNNGRTERMRKKEKGEISRNTEVKEVQREGGGDVDRRGENIEKA